MKAEPTPATKVGRTMLALCAALSLGGVAPPRQEPSRWTPDALSSADYEASPTFAPDGREIVFMRADPQFSSYRLLRSTCGREGWTTPVPLPFAAKSPATDADPFLARDGRRLYFVSTRGNTADQFDIWYVDRDGRGAWGEPSKLPTPVNSPGSELLPRIDRAGTLYFGSDRPGGNGQSDIYRATQRRGQWSVANVGPPVSTAANEFEAEVSADGQTLLVVADRSDRSHLYRFRKRDGRWLEQERIPARPDVFQVGPTLSPRADSLLFAQADGARSGEIFLYRFGPTQSRPWPPQCPSRAERR